MLAFPKLRQPETNYEAEKWGRLLRTVPINDPAHGQVRYAAVVFQRICERVEKRGRQARSACLCATILAVAVLLWATYYADCPVNRLIAWFTVGGGLFPALYFFVHDAYVVRLVSQATASRQRLERERPR